MYNIRESFTDMRQVHAANKIRKIKRENGFEKLRIDDDDLGTADLVIQFYLDLKKGDDN